MKVTKTFQGVPDGHVYPVEFNPGDDCPPELEAAGIELGCLEEGAGKSGGESKGKAASKEV